MTRRAHLLLGLWLAWGLVFNIVVCIAWIPWWVMGGAYLDCYRVARMAGISRRRAARTSWSWGPGVYF